MIANWLLLAASVLIGLVSAATTIRGMSARGLWPALASGFVAGVGASGLAAVVVIIVIGADIFAVIHLAYLVIVVGVPLFAGVVLVFSPPASVPVRSVLAGSLLLVPLGIYATHVEPFWLRIDRVTVPLQGDHPVDLRVGVLSDLQTEAIGDYERGAVAALLEQSPDIVLIPGDLWQTRSGDMPAQVTDFTSIINEICLEVDHVFVVQGNTDRLAGLREIVAGTPAVVLDNDVVSFTIGDVPVSVLGVTYGATDLELAGVMDEFSMQGSGDPIRIVLTHQPDDVLRLPLDIDVDLVVAGHTHGGQVVIPLFGPLVTYSSVPREVAAGGLHSVNGYPIYVSTGVGRERGYSPQVRFGVRPSIGVLDLSPGD